MIFKSIEFTVSVLLQDKLSTMEKLYGKYSTLDSFFSLFLFIQSVKFIIQHYNLYHENTKQDFK